ncbi:MAG: hypothetical protein AB1403_05675 [Candidatus Riflebacteria bacterium]
MPDYPEYEFSYEGTWEMYQRLNYEKSRLEQALNAKYPDRPKKVAENGSLITYDRLIKEVFSIYKAIEKRTTQKSMAAQFRQLQRIHYSLISDQQSETYPLIKSVTRGMGRFFSGPVKLRVSLPFDIEAPIGERKAINEAVNLVDSSGGEVSTEALAKLSPLEISRLEPIKGHTAYTGKPVGNFYQSFLNKVSGLVKMQSRKRSAFDFTRARALVFFKKLKVSATTPKFEAEDRYGCEWKLKFGREMHTDVVATRLYMDLGATYTDLKFISGPGETKVVLAPEKSKDPVKTLQDLKNQFLESNYKFNIEPYVLNKNLKKDGSGRLLGHGQIDAEMAERESIPKEFIGAWFVLFKECQLTFENPALARLGAVPLSTLGSLDDRVARASVVFNCWLQNRDVKDENCRMGFLFNETTGNFDRLVEFQSDQGNTFGGLKTMSPESAKGMLNTFPASFLKEVAGGIHFVMAPYYLPESWTRATWSDARWMALRIARLTRPDIERSVSESGWPSFVQRVATEKLISRRNELVKAFALHLDGIKPLECKPEITITIKGEKVVENGVINPDSALVKELELNLHPEGIASCAD